MKSPKTPEEAKDFVKAAVEDGEVEFAPTSQIDELWPFVEEVLKALGVKVRFVSDYTQLRDLFYLRNKPDYENAFDFVNTMLKAAKTLNIVLFYDDLLIDAARRLKESK